MKSKVESATPSMRFIQPMVKELLREPRGPRVEKYHKPLPAQFQPLFMSHHPYFFFFSGIPYRHMLLFYIGIQKAFQDNQRFCN